MTPTRRSEAGASASASEDPAHDGALPDSLPTPIVEVAIAPAAPSAPSSDSAPPLASSSRLGRYYVLHKIGEGGMGSVYVGYDEVLDRRVALKVLHRSDTARGWIVREGRALARLAHPNVVAIHEVGEHEGRVFLAMELVEGPTLRAWLAGSPRTFTDKLRLFLHAARGLAVAHRAGIVHRDFKPDNVLVGPDGRARVVDFGIAAVPSHAADASMVPEDAVPSNDDASPSPVPASLTRSGMLLGTPAYMSPEQFEGKRATGASDQWSYAIAFYTAAYGASPYAAEGLVRLAKRVKTEPPAPPPRTPDVPAWLWPILRRGLERAPSDRFASMDDLIAAIEKHVPRDPDLDPTVVVREREILSAVFCLAYLTHGVLLLDPSSARLLLAPFGLVVVPAVTLATMLLAVVVRRRELARNAYGRRLAWVFVGSITALLGHRLIDLSLGFTGAQILVGDAVLLALFYAIVAIFDHTWLFWLSALSAAVGVASAARIEDTAAIVGVGCLLAVAAMGVRLFVDRKMSAGSAVGLLDPETAIESPRNAGVDPLLAPTLSPTPRPMESRADSPAP